MKTVIGLAIVAIIAAQSVVFQAQAAQVNVNVNGYLPAPPGVEIHVSSGRPYYIERGRPVYLVRAERPHHRRHGRGHWNRDCYDWRHDRGRHHGHEGR